NPLQAIEQSAGNVACPGAAGPLRGPARFGQEGAARSRWALRMRSLTWSGTPFSTGFTARLPVVRRSARGGWASVRTSAGGASGPVTVVGAIATGAVMATVRSPWRQALLADIAAVRDQTFFMVCQGIGGQGLHGVVTGSRIYRFRVAGSGRIGGYSLVRGRTLAGLRAHELAVAADGSEVAVTTGPPAATGAAGSAEIMVIHTRTGAR